MLRWVPALTLLLFLGPVAAGLVGTWLPAFGILPALGGTELSLAPWRRLFAEPGLATSLRLTLTTGFAAVIVSLALVLAFLAACHGTRPVAVVRRLLAPLLAVPHVAVAIGFAFLASPSGWTARAVSPWLTGWDRPPDVATAPDPWGIALVCGLVLKEVPFLLLMALAALGQVPADRTLAVARSLGYGPATAWLKTVLPLVWPQIRLPVYAVLAYSLSVVAGPGCSSCWCSARSACSMAPSGSPPGSGGAGSRPAGAVTANTAGASSPPARWASCSASGCSASSAWRSGRWRGAGAGRKCCRPSGARATGRARPRRWRGRAGPRCRWRWPRH
jgi:ABC-type spermidine/putrescine transport system permease subunit II